MTRHYCALTLIAATVFLAPAAAPGQAPPRSYLLQTSQGQVFNDIAMEDKTKPEMVTDVADLGGRALKVAFAPGDAVGVKGPKVKNWKAFETFRLDAVNPGKVEVRLVLTVLHARSKDYNTRVVYPIKLKP